VALQAVGPLRSPQWTRRSVALDIPADAERIAISLVMTGDGEVSSATRSRWPSQV